MTLNAYQKIYNGLSKLKKLQAVLALILQQISMYFASHFTRAFI